MKKPWFLLIFMLALGAKTAMADDDLAKFQDDSRNVVKELMAQLGGAMQKEMKANGPVGTIKVCKDIAPAIASELSRKTGQRVTRVSLKVRNPLIGTADAWEQKVLMDFEKRVEKEPPANLEFVEVVTEPQGKYLRYMKAIPVQDICLACHGKPDAISQPVKEQLAAEYPHDKATGYATGQIRGAISIKKAL
jgi:hypothetical protein